MDNPIHKGSCFKESARRLVRIHTLARLLSGMSNKSLKLSRPGVFDVLINDQCKTLYKDSTGNRRMNDMMLEYKVAFHSAKGDDERSRIVETALAKVLKGGARFLREISRNDEESILWEEISQNDAADQILCALQAQDLGLVDMPKACATNALSPGPEDLKADDEEVDPSDADHFRENNSLDCADVHRHDSQKKRKIHPDGMRPIEGCDVDVPSLDPNLQNHDDVPNATTRRIPARDESDPTNAQRVLPSGQQPSTAGSDASVLQVLDSICDDILHHLSSAVSAAGLLTFLHFLEGEGGGVSNSLTVEIYDAIAPLVEQLAAVATRTQYAPRGSSTRLQDNVVETNGVSENILPDSFIPNQELLEAVFSLMQTLRTDENPNRGQATVKVMNMLLQAGSRKL